MTCIPKMYATLDTKIDIVVCQSFLYGDHTQWVASFVRHVLQYPYLTISRILITPASPTFCNLLKFKSLYSFIFRSLSGLKIGSFNNSLTWLRNSKLSWFLWKSQITIEYTYSTSNFVKDSGLNESKDFAAVEMTSGVCEMGELEVNLLVSTKK